MAHNPAVERGVDAQRLSLSDETSRFLVELRDNNDREWFKGQKDRFDSVCHRPFVALLERLTRRLSDLETPLTGGAATVFRLNRDVRFSTDKSPYKTSLSGLLTPSGAKNESRGLVYVQLSADGGFCAAGYYKLTPKELGPMRDAILENSETFSALAAALDEAGFAIEQTDRLRSMPRGYADYADHALAWALKLKTFIVRRDIPAADWTGDAAIDQIEELARAAAPLLAFFDRSSAA